MNKTLNGLPSLRAAAKAAAVINILVVAMLLPVILIAWTCSKIYRPRI